jgi:hypothetical protein
MAHEVEYLARHCQRNLYDCWYSSDTSVVRRKATVPGRRRIARAGQRWRAVQSLEAVSRMDEHQARANKDKRVGELVRTGSTVTWEARDDQVRFVLESCLQDSRGVTCSGSVINDGIARRRLTLHCSDRDAEDGIILVDASGLVHHASTCDVGGEKSIVLDPNVSYRLNVQFPGLAIETRHIRYLRLGLGASHVSFPDVTITTQ